MVHRALHPLLVTRWRRSNAFCARLVPGERWQAPGSSHSCCVPVLWLCCEELSYGESCSMDYSCRGRDDDRGARARDCICVRPTSSLHHVPSSGPTPRHPYASADMRCVGAPKPSSCRRPPIAQACHGAAAVARPAGEHLQLPACKRRRRSVVSPFGRARRQPTLPAALLPCLLRLLLGRAARSGSDSRRCQLRAARASSHLVR